MTIRKAIRDDIDILIKARLDFLHEDKGQLTEYEEMTIRSQLEHYYKTHINDDFIAVLGEINGAVVSTAFLVLQEKPANLSIITGKVGTLMNVFTYPEFRRKGYAEKIVRYIIEEAKGLGLSCIDIFATPKGQPLYRKIGFIEPQHTSMRLNLV